MRPIRFTALFWRILPLHYAATMPCSEPPFEEPNLFAISRKTRTIAGGVAGLLTLGMAGLVFSLYVPDKPRAVLEAAYPGTYRTVDGLRLRLRDIGPRDKPAVIMLHGFGASLDTWEPWAKVLSARYRVIRLDLPGFGLTGPDPSGDYGDARAMQIMVDLMDQLGIARASLIGNSMGGRIAWTFAALHPDRTSCLVLVSPDGFASPGFAYGRPPKIPLLMQALPYVAPRVWIRADLAAAYARPEALSEATLTRYRDMLLAPGVRAAILARTGQTILQDPAPILARITAPTLLLWGEKDGMIPIANATDYLRYLPHAVLVRLPNLGHVPFEEDPARSLIPIEHFLSGRTP